MKKIVYLFLICAMVFTSVSVSAVSSDDAVAYSRIIENLYSRDITQASTFLIDFDNDGRDELLVFWGSDWKTYYSGDVGGWEYYNYEVYSGSKLIGNGREDIGFYFYIAPWK